MVGTREEEGARGGVRQRRGNRRITACNYNFVAAHRTGIYKENGELNTWKKMMKEATSYEKSVGVIGLKGKSAHMWKRDGRRESMRWG